jgi:hypothetical protein
MRILIISDNITKPYGLLLQSLLKSHKSLLPLLDRIDCKHFSEIDYLFNSKTRNRNQLTQEFNMTDLVFVEMSEGVRPWEV